MKKIIKTNLETQFVSLTQGAKAVDLFVKHTFNCQAIYLLNNQCYSGKAEHGDIVISIFEGNGELTWKHGTENLVLHILTHDIIYIPHHSLYSILNLEDERLMLSFLNFGR